MKAGISLLFIFRSGHFPSLWYVQHDEWSLKIKSENRHIKILTLRFHFRCPSGDNPDKVETNESESPGVVSYF